MEISQQLKEILSWRLVSETVRRAPNRLRIYELHPGGGQYDCLSLNTIDGIGIADLNRAGMFHAQNQLRDIQDSNSPGKSGEGVGWGIWPETQALRLTIKRVANLDTW